MLSGTIDKVEKTGAGLFFSIEGHLYQVASNQVIYLMHLKAGDVIEYNLNHKKEISFGKKVKTTESPGDTKFTPANDLKASATVAGTETAQATGGAEVGTDQRVLPSGTQGQVLDRGSGTWRHPTAEELAEAERETRSRSSLRSGDALALILGMSTIKINAVVNLGNFSALHFEVSGPASSLEDLRQYLIESLGTFGRKDPATAELIDHYIRRALER